MAARYTHDRRENFDVYLPVWLAKYNKSIFGTLYFAVVVFALVRWARAPSWSRRHSRRSRLPLALAPGAPRAGSLCSVSPHGMAPRHALRSLGFNNGAGTPRGCCASSFELDSHQLHATRSTTLDGHRGLAALEVLGEERYQLLIGFAANWS